MRRWWRKWWRKKKSHKITVATQSLRLVGYKPHGQGVIESLTVVVPTGVFWFGIDVDDNHIVVVSTGKTHLRNALKDGRWLGWDYG
jgi:hypothetical protein